MYVFKEVHYISNRIKFIWRHYTIHCLFALSLTSEDANNISSVITEMNETLASIRQAFVENESEILDSDEKEKR